LRKSYGAEDGAFSYCLDQLVVSYNTNQVPYPFGYGSLPIGWATIQTLVQNARKADPIYPIGYPLGVANAVPAGDCSVIYEPFCEMVFPILDPEDQELR